MHDLQWFQRTPYAGRLARALAWLRGLGVAGGPAFAEPASADNAPALTIPRAPVHFCGADRPDMV